MTDPTTWFTPADGEIAICGVGARTPLGFNAAASAAAVRAGISAVEAQELLDKVGEPISLARDPDFDSTVPITERMQQMLLSAMAEAVGDDLEPQVLAQVPCYLCVPEPRPGLPEDIGLSMAGAVSAAGGVSPSTFHTMSLGHASGLMAMQAAAKAISSGRADMCLVAAADSYHDPITLDSLDRSGQLMSGENRNGFPPGEAAGACLLASAAAARRYGLHVLGHVAAAATAFEPKSIRSQDVCTGAGLTIAINGVTAGLNLPRQAISGTYCDLNGQRYRNEEFVYTLLRVQEAFVDAHDYLCPADCWGDVGAASGPLFVALAIAAGDRGYAKGPFPLLWSGSESGYRSAVVLRLREREDRENLR